jgi:deoxyribonuclease-4
MRAAMIGAEFLVVHPGSHRGNSVDEGIAAFVRGLRDAAHGLDTGGVTVLLENTAGAGSHLGSRFADLQSMRDLAGELTGLPVGFCLDTCHLLAAGFDVATQAGLRATLQQAEATLGIANVRVIHANDSKGALASHLDRHANIGEGQIGREAFNRILTHPKLRAKPFILETPVENEGDDRRNLDSLKLLARRGALIRR